MSRQRLAATAWAALLLIVALAERAWAACPSCKEGLAGADRWAQGFNASILFMLVMPFAVVGVIAGAVYRASRQRNTSACGAPEEHTPPDPG